MIIFKQKIIIIKFKVFNFCIIIALDIKISIIKFEVLINLKNWNIYKLIKTYSNIKSKNYYKKNYTLNILPINIKIFILNMFKVIYSIS